MSGLNLPGIALRRAEEAHQRGNLGDAIEQQVDAQRAADVAARAEADRAEQQSEYAGKQPAVEVQGSTVGEALSGLVSQHPELRRHLYTDEGKLRAFVNVYLNDEDVRYLQKDATAVQASDNISIVPSIAGGSPIE